MPENETLEEAIRRNASGPKSAEVDGQKVEQHSLADQIAADEYLASKKAVKSRTSSIDVQQTQIHFSEQNPSETACPRPV